MKIDLCQIRLRNAARGLSATLLLLPLASASYAVTVTPRKADTAADAVGVNISRYYNWSGYESTITAWLYKTGIRHIRASVPGTYPTGGNTAGGYDAAYGPGETTRYINWLNQAGIRDLLIAWPNTSGNSSYNPWLLVSALNGDTRIVNSAVPPCERVETNNEFDTNAGNPCGGDSTWTSSLITQTTNNWNNFHTWMPVVGPSFLDTKDSPGMLHSAWAASSSYMNYGNLHVYPITSYIENTTYGGGNPCGTAASALSAQQDIDNYGLVSGANSQLVSETGYHNTTGGITQKATAIYLPRIALTFLGKNVPYSYFYELLDSKLNQTGSEANFGLITSNATQTTFTPKTQFYSIRNFIALLGDRDALADTTWSPSSLTYTTTGAPTDMISMAFQKRDGRSYLVFWRPWQSCTDAGVDNPLTATNISVTFTSAFSQAIWYRPSLSTQTSDNGPTAGGSASNTTTISNVPIADDITVIEVRPSCPLLSGIETADTQPLSNTVDSSAGVTAATCAPVVVTNDTAATVPHNGVKALAIAGTASGGASTYDYFKIFTTSIPITSGMKLRYWINPQQANGRYVAVDFHCTDGTTLGGSAAIDQNGYSMSAAAGHGGSIKLGQWSEVRCTLPAALVGKTIDKVDLAFDHAGATGAFKAYIDDIQIK